MDTANGASYPSRTRKETSTASLPFWETISRSSLIGTAHVRSRRTDEHSIYGQGLKEVRRPRRLGVRTFQQRRNESRRRVHENLFSLPPENQRARSLIHPLRTLRPIFRRSKNPR